MMKSRVLTLLVAFLMITVAFSVAFMDSVSADDPENWEPDNDEAIYLRPGDPGETKFYNHNYTDVAVNEDVELRDTSGGEKKFSYDSEMSLTANVRSVKPCPDNNEIRIAISAPGAYRWNESESINNPNDSDIYFTPFGHVGTLGTAIEAEITGMEGYEGDPGDPGLQIQTRYNSGDNFTDGDVGDSGVEAEEWQKLAVEGSILAAEIGLNAAGVPTLGALSATYYATKLASTYAEKDPIDPLPEHDIGDSGEGASVSQSWEHNIDYKAEREYHLFNLGYSEYEEHLEEGPVDQELVDAFDEKGYEIDDGYDLDELDNDKWAVVNENGGFFTLERYENKLKIYGKDIPLKRVHTASTMLYFELPTDDLPDEATLEISAKNILGVAEQDGEIIDFADGAEASVEIPINNAEPQSVKNEPTSDTYTTYTGSKSVSTTLGAILPHNLPVPKVQYLNVSWGDNINDETGKRSWEEVKHNWEPYSYDNNEFTDKETVASHTYTGITEGITETYEIKVKVVMQDKYGGWIYEGNGKSIDITYPTDGGGGGGCPYISPWNGTKYKQENNLLVQSESQSVEVTDYYKLDTELQQKNGQYSMKIEEFENSEDYIDQMKLYTIDHKEGYKVGVTPDGEYITYNDSDAPLNASYSTSENVLDEIEQKDDGQRLQMNSGSEIIIDYGDRSMSRWQFNKLILRNSGFSSNTEESQSQIGIMADKTSLYVSIKADGSEWKNVTVTHPRNNPRDYVIPLEDQIMNMLSKGHDLDDFKVKIRSTEDHNIDYVGLDNSAPTTVHVQEADIQETLKTDIDGNTKYLNRSLTADDNAVMHLVPDESCTVNFDVPSQIPGLEKRDFIVMAKGFYTRYE